MRWSVTCCETRQSRDKLHNTTAVTCCEIAAHLTIFTFTSYQGHSCLSLLTQTFEPYYTILCHHSHSFIDLCTSIDAHHIYFLQQPPATPNNSYITAITMPSFKEFKSALAGLTSSEAIGAALDQAYEAGTVVHGMAISNEDVNAAMNQVRNVGASIRDMAMTACVRVSEGNTLRLPSPVSVSDPLTVCIIQERVNENERAGTRTEQRTDLPALTASFAIPFTIIEGGVLSLGFGSAGIGAGTAAAAFQPAMYAGATPAGSIFATLQSAGMLGTLGPMALVPATVVGGAFAVAYLCKARGQDEAEGDESGSAYALVFKPVRVEEEGKTENSVKDGKNRYKGKHGDDVIRSKL